MIKRILLLVISVFVLFLLTPPVQADEVPPGRDCKLGVDVCKDGPLGSYDCTGSCVRQPDGSQICTCQLSPVKGAFGKVKPPPLLAEFLKNDPTGASAISQFLSNFIALLFSIAAIVLIFMIIWGALDWTTSGGDKEKLAGAQKRIVHAIIGMILFAVAFAALAILGRFTGFTLFRGQNYTVLERYPNGEVRFRCVANETIWQGRYTNEEAEARCR